MRGKLLVVLTAIGLCFLLSSCRTVVNSPADEIRLFNWSAALDNGSTATLRFKDTNAYLTVENEDVSLDIGGLCLLGDEKLTICDSATSVSFPFSYRLYGDRIELTWNGGTITLDKEG